MPETAARFAPAAAPERCARRRGWVLEIAPEVACVQQPIVNLYLVGPPGAGDRAWVLVDAGLAFFGSRIVRATAERFGPRSRPSAILLTHGHFDHVGTLPHLADVWDVPVYAHECELPYVTGGSSYPPPDPAVGGGAMSLLSRFYPRGPINLGKRARALPGDGTVPGLPNWRWLATPGHSPGHVSFFRNADRVLVAGDAFVTTKQESALAALTQPQEVRRPPAYYTEDWQAAHRSVERLASLEPEVAATGHGLPMYGARLRQQLNALARDFEHVALPSHGRYVDHPAITNKHGVVQVPPPVLDRQLVGLAGIGLGAVIGGLLLREWSKRSGADRLSDRRCG